MTIPTFITIGRILLVPVTIWLIISGAYGLPLSVSSSRA